MDFLPVFLNLKNRPCLVVGGGEIAARKVALLLQAGADVTVVAPELGPTLAQCAQEGRISYRKGRFAPEDMPRNCAVVVAATDQGEVNRQVSEIAQSRNIPVNVVDHPELCSFIMPAIIDRSPVIIAVSTGGSSPVLARLLRARLESTIPAAYGRLAAFAERFRAKVKARFGNTNERRMFWEKILQGTVAEMVFTGQEEAAAAALEQELKGGGPQGAMGEVYLVGGGPGDPDLLTFRALRLMQQADVVVYDRLVAPAVLELTRRDAARIYVGKERDNHAVPQDEINRLLVRLAKEGKRVLRLKGGDPFVFGRGGEEIDTLMEEGVRFQVVPGITAATGCAAYSGIPLTHRDYAQSCVFVTGHLKDGTTNLNWEMLAQPNQTVVFYMGIKGIEVICSELIKHGVSPDMPAALVQQGTTPQQRVHTGTLRTLPDIVKTQDVRPPTLIIVGNVVKLHEKLSWFKPTGEVGIWPRSHMDVGKEKAVN